MSLLSSTSNTLVARLLTVVFVATLYACAAPTKKDELDTAAKSLDDIISKAVQSDAQSEEYSAEYYILLAKKSTGDERQQHLLKAADLLLQRGDIEVAEDYLQTLKTTDSNLLKTQFLAARIALANNNPNQAIQLLPEPALLNTRQTVIATQIRAQAKLLLGQTIIAIEKLVAIESQIDSVTEKEKNHNVILSSLLSLPTITLANYKPSNKIIAGWADLARLLQKSQTRIGQLQNNILDWGTKYTQHPVSNEFIDNLMNEYLSNVTISDSVAVMLPVSGPYKATTSAIKSGFLSAYYSDEATETRPLIRFYDTSDEDNDFNNLYQQAQLDGVNFIVGPINKDTVTQLTLSTNLAIPILTLNYAEENINNTENLFQFGLLPEDEARQVAELAISNNHMNAAVLTPESSWGQRLYTAFKEHYEDLGGEVLSAQQYPANVDDYSRQIKKLFNLEHSYSRRKDIEHILGTGIHFEPYRRQDIDMIFMAATYRSARGIMPAFKFHRAGDVPVYSTSHAYTGHVDKKQDKDLNGLLFCDMPWTLTDNSDSKKIFTKHWRKLNDYTRLYALGVDAYHLMRNINYLKNDSTAHFAGETGTISIDENNRLHRELVWAEFKHGRPVYVDTTSQLKLSEEKLTQNAANQP